MVYLLAGCLLVLTVIVGALLWALHTGNTRLHEFMTMVMTRQDMQLRLFGDRMLSINEAASQQMQQERITQEVIAGSGVRPIVRTEPPAPDVPNFKPDRIGGD